MESEFEGGEPTVGSQGAPAPIPEPSKEHVVFREAKGERPDGVSETREQGLEPDVPASASHSNREIW